MDNGAITGICCFLPTIWTAFVFWAGKGFPGWPWKVQVSRRGRGAMARYYHDDEV
jgi:hypothetical protein